MANNLEEKVMSADGVSSVEAPVHTAGGKTKRSSADVMQQVDPNAETVTDGVTKKTNKPLMAVEAKMAKMKSEMDDMDDEDDDMDGMDEAMHSKMKSEKMAKMKKMKSEMDDMDDVDDMDEAMHSKMEKMKSRMDNMMKSEKMKTMKAGMDESFDITDLFEGLDLSEDFKGKATLVFEAAVHEAATAKAASIVEAVEADLQEQFNATLTESLDEIVENLDGYLDYVVKEWMEENTVAVESGIKVEMAESLMVGLKELFYEHNIEIDEDTIDVVAGLEEELDAMKATARRAINDRLDLEEEIKTLRGAQIFETMVEGLSVAQVERLRVLSEKLDNSDHVAYAENLKTLKESFFKAKKDTVISESLNQEDSAPILEESVQKKISQYDSINAYASAMKNFK